MQGGTIDLEAGCRPAEIKAAWIAALDRHLDWDDLPGSCHLLNAVLQALHESLAKKAIRRCGMACEAAVKHDNLDPHPLLRGVAIGFRPDRLKNPEGAVAAVLDVLDPELDELGLLQVCEQLLQSAGTPSFNPGSVKWSASWPNPA